MYLHTAASRFNYANVFILRKHLGKIQDTLHWGVLCEGNLRVVTVAR